MSSRSVVSASGAGPGVVELIGVPRDYAWGSRTAIQQLLGREPDGDPLAELWFGAHPHDPSPVPSRSATLDALIGDDPQAWLGRPCVARFGPRLPYLVKLLAADTALSIQVHPNRTQAEEGFAREDAAGIAIDAAQRNYKDANHKPELLCALTPFDALCGFRTVAETLALLADLDVPELGFLAGLLRGPDPLRAAFTELLTLRDATDAVAAVVRRAAAAEEGPLYGVRLAAEHFPSDIGVVVALLLNYVRLEPGEAIFLGAGNVHAYLRGTAVEVMANSDNVLRCGLTSKHVDVAELLRITDFTSLPEPRVPSLAGRFDVPVPDFSLSRVSLGGRRALDADGPCIVLVTGGELTVDALRVPRGGAAFVPAGRRTTLAGDAEAFLASAGC